MKGLSVMNRIIKVSSVILLVMLQLTACNRDKGKFEVYGGELVKNVSMYSSDNKSELSYEFPIIISEKIDDFSVDVYNISGVGDYKIKTKKLTGGEEYNGWFYYYGNITVKIAESEPANFSIDSIDMLINDKEVHYEMSKMQFYNTLGYYNESVISDSSDIVYANGSTYLYQNIPENEDEPESMELEINNDCIITEFKALDLLNVTNLKVFVNNKEADSKNGIVVHAGDRVVLQYNLKYKENISKKNLLKATKLISYLNSDGKKCVFIDTQGFMIIAYDNDSFIKEYIDTLGENR